MKDYSWEELQVGLTASFAVRITEGHMDRFAELSGDCNPLHVDAGYAVARGHRGRVVHGLLVASFYSTLVGVHLPGRRCLLHAVDVKFVSPVFAGDELTVEGRVEHLTEAYRQVVIAGRISRAGDELVSRAKIMVGVT